MPGGFPGTGSYPVGWVPRLFPFIDQANRQQAAINLFSPTDFWTRRSPYRSNSQNNPIWGPVPTLSCPSSPLGDTASDQPTSGYFPYVRSQGALHYRANAGAHNPAASHYVLGAGSDAKSYSTSGVLYPLSKTRFSSITDGTSNTLLLGETSDNNNGSSRYVSGFGGLKPWVWGFYYYSGSPPGYLLIDHKMVQYPIGYTGSFNTNVTPYISAHSGGGVNAALCDGSVRFLSKNMDLNVLKSLATRSSGEVVGEY